MMRRKELPTQRRVDKVRVLNGKFIDNCLVDGGIWSK
jgi:hypothetical protein